MSPEELVDLARAQGWRVRQTRNGWMVFPLDPTKAPVTIHRTPSDYRASRNAYRLMVRSGLRTS